MARYLGVDLAWGEGTSTRPAKETGLVCVDDRGTVVDAGWARGIDAVTEWLIDLAQPGDVIAIDAPLVVTNQTGMRDCERQVGQRYGRWRVSANSTNLGRGWQGGVALRRRLESSGFVYDDGVRAEADVAVRFFECYPYTALVGATEFGYEVERPRYKRPHLGLPSGERQAFRASECDELIRRFAGFGQVAPPINLASHPATRALLDPSPLGSAEYKHREDLLDAAICAWTAALWATTERERCQVLGEGSVADERGRRAVIIAPAREEQRR